MKVRTRFAPSPTGYLHVGGVRTALFAWLVARQNKGELILRIEDTDRTRHVEEAEAHIVESLKWLGLNWDEGPFRQSERLHIYKEWADKLYKAGHAYADPYTHSELDELRAKAIKNKKPFLYRNHRPKNPPIWSAVNEGYNYPLRLKSNPKSYKWNDAVMGDLSAPEEAVDDFILIKSDGYPTYNFAHIIDDHLMKVSHVIRSQEFLSSVPKFLNLYESLKIKPPVMATLPYVLAGDGKKKLSKRDGAKDILDYKREGYMPEALINLIATLGWNDGSTQELFTVKELVKKFALERVHKGGARFDEERLKWINGHTIRELELDKLFVLSAEFWPASAKKADDHYKKNVLSLVQERLKFLAELPALTYFFFETPKVDKELLADKKIPASEAKIFLEAATEKLATNDFTYESLEKDLRSLCDDLNTKPAILFSLIRRAVTGGNVAPGLFETLELLGKEVVIARVQHAVSIL